jgi:primosomal protein N' (replication factor Y)
VRVKVSGRRLKGFVTAMFEADEKRRLLKIEGVSGDIPSFDDKMLSTLRWAALHYVTPLSVLLKRTIPPNVPKRSTFSPIESSAEGVLPPATSENLYHIGSPPYGASIARAITDVAASGSNIAVIGPSAIEIAEIADYLTTIHGDRVVRATSSMSGSAVTASWTRMVVGRGTILVGTRETMFWPFGDVGRLIIIEDGRRVMRSPGTPTLNVRHVISKRSAVEGFPLEFFGPVPTLEAVAMGASIVAPNQRQWPMVEVVDRGEEPPGAAVLTERVKSAIRGAVASQSPVFVLVGSRGYAPAFRCVACGEIRRCANCSSAASRDDTCRRCGANLGGCTSCGAGRFQALGAGIGRIIDDISGVVGSDMVGRPEDDRLVTVGTERDLIGVHGMGLSVAVDIDGFTMAPHYRAAEDGLRLLVRLAQTVKRGTGSRCVIQTADPNQPVVAALVHGRSQDFLLTELALRRRFGFPPVGSLIAIETDDLHDAGELLLEAVAPHASVLGPATVGERKRWLIQGRDLDSARLALRPVVSSLRSKGAKVRVDVDPIDL